MRRPSAAFPTLRCLAAAALVTVLGAAGCSDAGFKGKNGTPGAAEEDDPVPPGAVSETFKVVGRKGSLDMVWIVDNSLSMGEEAAIVRANFDGFITALEARTDIRLALISRYADNLGADLSAAQLAKGHTYVEQSVASTNPLALIASALCPVDSTEPYLSYPGGGDGRMRLCGNFVDTLDFEAIGPLEDPLSVEAVRGKLQGFFRPDAQRAFVIVTDDNAAFVADPNFLPIVRPLLGAPPLKVFAFAALEASTCGTTARGTAYEALAKATGGLVFDVCTPDWSANYQTLSDAVADPLDGRITVASPTIASVESVKIDGVAIDPATYKIEGNALVLDPSLLARPEMTVEVVYKAGG